MKEHTERSDPVQRARELVLNVEGWLDSKHLQCKGSKAACGHKTHEYTPQFQQELADWAERELRVARVQRERLQDEALAAALQHARLTAAIPW